MSNIRLPESPRLFLIDGYALIYRSFFALISRPLTTNRGENTSVAWGIANFLRRLRATHNPEYIGWVHDSGASFRDELYPDYKATREKLSDDLQADFNTGLERVSQLLAAYNLPIIAVDGYEADDVIGSLAARANEAGLNVVIVSGDKDFQQLVNTGTWLLNPGRGGPAGVEEQWVGMENADERLGVPPSLVTDYLALVGDSSDNVPGVKGIGSKTAVELINEYGPLEEILAHAGDIKKKRPREALAEYAEEARLSKQLVTIHRDVPVEFDREAMRAQEPDISALRQLYLELEFASLTRELAGQTAAAPVPDLAGGAGAALSTGATPGSAAGANDTAAAAAAMHSTDSSAPTATPIAAQGSASGAAMAAVAALHTALAVADGEHGVPVLVGSSYHTVNDVDALRALTARLGTATEFALQVHAIPDKDAPSATDPLRSSVVALSIAIAPGEAWYLPLAHSHDDGGGNLGLLSGELGAAGKAIAAGVAPPQNLPGLVSPELQELRDILANPAVGKIMHDAKYQLLAFRSAGVELRGISFDTMLASYVLDPGRRSHDLELLALEFLKHSMTPYEQVGGKGRYQIAFDGVPIAVARDYACQNVDIALRLRDIFVESIRALEMLTLYNDIELPLIGVLARMEWEGIAIDLDWFAELKRKFQSEREAAESAIYEEAGEKFNINSNPQLRNILFGKLGLPVKKKTATGPSTDASVLQELADEGHSLPSLLMEYRELFKLEGTYVDALPRLVHPRDNRLHTTFNQTVAATGRLSSSDPNLQNIPIRRELGRAIRRGFVPRSGWTLFSADYSQIELRLLAHLSGDESFVKAFRAGGDIHRQTAAVIFGVDIEDVTAEMRARAKTINFATIYGQGAHALSRQLGIPHAEAKAFIDTYFERFAGVRAFMDKCVADARERGYVETIFHRRRYVPELRERNFNIRAFGERVAANAPIQGSAADLIKIAMIRIDSAISSRGYASRMLLQVHDELVFELAPGEEQEMGRLVKEEMEGVAKLDVPLVVASGNGANWLELK